MLSLALATLRTRRLSLAGTFAALALGVTMTAALALALAATLSPARQPKPQRFAQADAVIRPSRTLAVPGARGSRTLDTSRGLAPDLVARVSAAVPVVPDRTFPAHVIGNGPSSVGHPWSVARFGGYRLTAGTAPRRPDEIVLATGEARVGDRVSVLTASAERPYTVSGTVTRVGFEHAVFFADAEAARLSPRVDGLAVTGLPDAARRAVEASGVSVLTGDARHDADPDPDRERRALNDADVLLGIAAGIAGFVAVFVVASTFALSVAQRRRELALLRLIGATPRQVRRMLTAEALLVGLLAAATGCAVAPVCARLLGHWLVAHRLAPSWFTVPVAAWPLVIAFLTGPAVALIGVAAASRRAGRVRPAEALREAAVESRTMTPVRLLFGLAAFGGGLATLVTTAVSDPASAANRKGYTPAVMLLITGAALLAPLLVPPLARLLTRPLARSGGATGLLVRENTLAAARRTASVAAPVLITVGLAGSLLGTGASADATKSAEARHNVRADFVVRPTRGDTVSAVVLQRLRTVPGMEAVPSAETHVYAIGDGGNLRRYEAQIVRPGDLARIARMDVRKGSIAALGENDLIVDDDWGKKPGDVVNLWLGDGTRTSVRVAAVMKSGLDDGRAYLTSARADPAQIGRAEPSRTGRVEPSQIGRIDVLLRPGADKAAVAKGLRAATEGLGVETVSARDAADGSSGKGGSSRLGILVTLGIALAYCGISVAGTLAMAAAGRSRDQAVLRLSGATPAQVARVALGEAVLVVCVGVVALAVSAVSLAGFWMALNRVTSATALVVPWTTLAAVTAACVLIALLATLVPMLSSLRSKASASGLRG
ncbi:ABC transporter permease [Actinomadura rupiterrae]|uniref:ABC transporter permease n=1 Tax=Actinomadura rupiterrae TaxID=559627 RepID=UPI0020A415F7|nr:ABC transporter permease [Actinomadura rupiterrae]MCP2341761.1 putative ABC transport system permease protein [Actinomadura rupiterrae]